ncbi:MAG: mechanosensitive ion channel [Pirellulales bacterium]
MDARRIDNRPVDWAGAVRGIWVAWSLALTATWAVTSASADDRGAPAALPDLSLIAVSGNGDRGAKPELPRSDTARLDAVRADAVRAEPAKSDPAKAEAGRSDSTRTSSPASKRADDVSVSIPGAVIESPSAAEKVSRLRRSIEADQRRMSELQTSIQDPSGVFGKSEEDFRKVDERLESLRSQHTKSEKDQDRESLTRIEIEIKEAQEAREKAKVRFEAAIAERRAAQEAVQNLELKIRSDQEALDKLLGQGPAPPASDVTPPPPVIVAPAAPGTIIVPTAAIPVPAPPPPTTVADLLQTSAGTKLPTAAPLAAPASASPAPVIVPTNPAQPVVASASPPLVAANKSNKANNKDLQEAAVVAQRTAAEANRAEQEVRSVTERIELLKRNIDAERRLRDSSQVRAEEADLLVHKASEEMHRALLEGRDASAVVDQLQEAEEQRREARREASRLAAHLDELQTEFAQLQSEQIAALEEAQNKRDVAEAALRRVETLQNPFTPRNILQWLIDHAPRVIGILVAIAVTLWLSRVMGRRIIGLLVGHGLRDSLEERENRAHTLAGVVHNAINVGAVAVGLVTILDEVGVPVGPVMGGAAVLGLAVAFGAQSLIKDYFTGFMLLVEQQYLVNDVVRIGDISGQVERISLRMTVLRDIEGQAHFIPHGQITTVSNLTHSWSRAVFEINISYRENVDRAIEELVSLARELRHDPQFERLITEDVTMLGVDELGESAVMIKFFLKTRAMQQWTVKRELLRRIKNRFDELGIEIPFPQSTVHIRESTTGRTYLPEAA